MLSAASYLEAAWHSRPIAAQTEPVGMALAQSVTSPTRPSTRPSASDTA